MRFCKYFLFFFLTGSAANFAEAQTAFSIIERDLQRDQQLLDSNHAKDLSFTQHAGNMYYLDAGQLSKQGNIAKENGLQVQWLPVGFTVQSNSHHPYGWNDGSMIPSKGLQTQVSAGIRLTSGKFSLQLQPEMVNAENPVFDGFPTEHENYIWYRYYKYLNQLDMPEQFGTRPYQKVFAGQSSIRFNTRHYSVGISTENLWWGPGRRNALVMSYNAPGFLHATFNSTKPLQTKIGSFEWQVIAGQLEASNINPPETNRVFAGQFLYQPKKTDQRYLTGAVVSWQPKWVKGFWLGFSKASYLYMGDLSGIGDMLPLAGIIKTKNEQNGQKATLGSLFVRYMMPEDKTELYFEYGRSDKTPNPVNIFRDEVYPKAFVFGLHKLFPLAHKDQYISFSTEFTQLQLDNASLILDDQSYSWYTHPYIRQGYTNMGQVMGAGIGPGSNSQYAGIAWQKGPKKIGLSFERIVRNNDFYYYAYQPSGDFNRHWIDLSTTLVALWDIKRFFVAANIALIRSLNYEWYLVRPDQGASDYFKGGWDVLNLHGQVSVRYRL